MSRPARREKQAAVHRVVRYQEISRWRVGVPAYFRCGEGPVGECGDHFAEREAAGLLAFGGDGEGWGVVGCEGGADGGLCV